MKICTKCHITKDLNSFHKNGKYGFYSICKDCKNTHKNLYRKEYPWRKTLSALKQRCKNMDDPRYGGKGIKALISEEEIKELWFRDKAYNLKEPSIDRLDSDGHYEFGNCRFIELKENTFRMNKARIKPILQYDLEGNFIKEWESISEASKFYNTNKGNISNNAIGRCKSSGNYIWRYKNEI